MKKHILFKALMAMVLASVLPSLVMAQPSPGGIPIGTKRADGSVHQNNDTVLWSAALKRWIASAGGGGGSFITLSDAPATYAGAFGYLIRVKTDGSGVEFLSPTTYLPLHSKADTAGVADSATGNAGTVTNGVYTTGAGTVFQPPAALTYVLNAASVSPVIPAGGAKIKVFIGMNGSGTNTGLAQNCTINAPATGGTAVDGQEFEYWVLDDGTSTARVLTLVGFTALGAVLPTASNGAATQKFIVFNGKYAAASWKVLGVSYE